MYNTDYLSHNQSYYPYGYVPWMEQTAPYVADAQQYYAASPSVCLDHLKGICTDKRVRCKFAHPPVPSHVPVPTPISDLQVCSVWVLTGFCKFGAKCRYYHPPSAEAAVCAPAITTKMMAFIAKQACWTPDHSDSEGISSEGGESEDAMTATGTSDWSGEVNLVATPPTSPEKLVFTNTPSPSHCDAVDALVRKVTGILNRITPEKFDSLSRQLLDLVGQDEHLISTALSLVFAKGCSEEHLAEVYSRLCKTLFTANAGMRTFITITLLDLGRKVLYDTSAVADALGDDRVAVAKLQAKQLTCARFVGQLFYDDLISSADILEFLDVISQSCDFADCFDDDAEPSSAFGVELVCKLLTHAGKRLDEQWKDAAEPYYEMLRDLLARAMDPERHHCGRLRVLVCNLMDLRTAQKWVPRRDEDKPRPISTSPSSSPASSPSKRSHHNRHH